MLLEEVKEAILEKYDPDDICEALHISSEDLLNAFEGKLVQYIRAFEDDLEVGINEFYTGDNNE